MAKAKKQEQTLEDMLIPESEQPYAVPDNWVYFFFTNLIDVQGGTQPPKSTFVEYPREGYVRLVQIRDFASDKHAVYIPDKGNLRKFSETDVMIARYGASLGRICRGLCGAYNVALCKTIFSHKVIDADYLFWLLQSECFQAPLTQLSRTAQVGFNKEDLSHFPIPLPPLPEQHRIVERIESLFEKLDRAKELAQNALDSFETRKAAILHKAFTGELTAKWRKENGVELESWENTTIGKISKIGSGGTPSRTNPQYFEGKIPWVKTGEIDWNIITDTEEHITSEAIENSSAKLFPTDTVLVAMYGQGLTRGRAAILGINATTNQAVCALQPNEETFNYYLYYYFACNYWELREKAVGGNQPNFSGTIISKFPIRLPTLPEQKEIVRILDSFFEKEQRAKELCDVIDKIDLMKKAILARAFRGELGTNDPNEESAVELLNGNMCKK